MRTFRNLPVPSQPPALPAAAAPIATEEEGRGGLSIAQITAIVWAYRKISVLIAVSIVALSFVVIKLLPKTYEATSQLLLNYEVNDPLSGNIFPTGLLASYMATQMQIMQSPEFIGSVVDDQKLESNKEFTAGYNGKSSLRDYTKTALLKHLQIVQGTAGSQLMYISVSSENPNTAAQIANAIATLYTSQQVKRLNDPATARAQRYEQELAELKQKFDAAQDKVAAYRQRVGITELGISDNDADTQNLNAIEARLIEAQANRRQLEIKEGSNQTLSTTVMTSNTVLMLKNQIATLETQLAQARTTFGEQHPRIIELKTQIDAAKTELNKTVNNFSDSTSAELDAARALESKLTAARDAQKAKVLQVRQNMDEGKKLLLELESARQSYRTMLDSYDKIQSSATSGYNNVSVASNAEVPVEATKPKKMKLLALAILAALGAAIGAPLAYELAINRRIRVRDDMEKDMGLPVLAEFRAAAASGVSR